MTDDRASQREDLLHEPEPEPEPEPEHEPEPEPEHEPEPEPHGGPRVELPDEQDLAQIDGYEQAASLPEGFRPVEAIAWSFGLGLVGAVIWAFITYVTEYELGLIAILLGIMAGAGAARGGRTQQSQLVGAAAAGVCYFVAQVLVIFAVVLGKNEGASLELATLVPILGVILPEIVKETFSSMGILFLGIAIYEGYRIPRPA